MVNSKAAGLSVSVLGVLTCALLAFPQSSYAYWRGHGHFYHYHDHPRFGLHLSFLPSAAFTVRLGGARYYYYDGIYYNRIGPDYVVVEPPIGSVVTTIPTDYQPVIINGMTYYTDNGVYYVYTRNGYQVVPQPVVAAPVVQSAPVESTPAPVSVANSQADTDDTFTVNIPNDKGGYTAVVIKKSGKGYAGPQGEFYPEFPKVSQLKAMYGK